MIHLSEVPFFFSNLSELNLEDYVLLQYRFETSESPRLAAAALACEQSTAQWKRPEINEDFRPTYGAKVVDLRELKPSVYEVSIAHPHRNFGNSIPGFLSAAAGEGPFYCPGIKWIKWIDFKFPESYLKKFEGPQFGLKGIRQILKIEDRPLFIGVVKPNIGLPPKDFGEIVYESLRGGLDVAKDDEMLADTVDSPLSERTYFSGLARKKAEKESGQKKIFVANLTGEIDSLLTNYESALKNGANTMMINSIFTGFPLLRFLRKKSEVPLFGHFTGASISSRVENFGIESHIFTKLQRLCGADFIVFAGFGERMHSSDEEVLKNVQACLDPWGPILPSLPMPGGSDWAGTLPKIHDKLQTIDFGLIAGRGVFGHPHGPAAGAKSLHQAWEGIRNKIPLKEFSKREENSELRGAIKEYE